MKKIFLLVALMMVFPIMGNAATLSWDRNTESDMKEYSVYSCPIIPPLITCTVIKSAATRLGVVPQVVASVLRPSFVLPIGVNFMLAVSATDLTGNESGLSVSVPFDSKFPIVPVNPRIDP